MISDSDLVIDELLRWCRAHGIQIDARIHVVRGEDGSIIVLSRDAFIEPRTTLVSIPKSAILSTRNCALAELIPQVIYGKEAQLGLALALYGELLNGSSSPWFGYLQSLPERVSIPLFWDDTKEDEKLALEWIKGTMVEVELSNSSQEVIFKSTKGSRNPLTGLVDDYFESVALPTLSSAGLGDRATIEGFRHAYALVSSRSFVVDTYHGLAMVPVADAFNHSSENQVHLETDYEVCRYCGSLTECPHDAEDEPGGGRPSLLPDRASNATDTSENTCEMVTNAPVLPFTEVYNTYGEHLMNSQLLVRYGFVLDVNENDAILWDAAMLTRFVNSIAGCSWKSTEMRSHEESASQSQRSGQGTDILEKVLEDTTKQHSEIPILEDGATHPKTVVDHNDLVFELSPFILRRVNDVLQLWGHYEPALTDSSLVYFSDDTGQKSNFNILDPGEEASGMESGYLVPPLSRKCARFHFALDDETRISHHLWIFCVLLALHSPHLRLNTHTDAGRRCGSGALEVFHSPMNTKCEKDTQELQYQENYHIELKAASLSTTAIEDVTILKRTFLVQKSLETVHPILGPEAVNFSDGGIQSPSRAESSAFSAMKSESERNKFLPVAREERVEQELLSSAKTLQQYESHSDRSRKRTRASSIASSTSHQREGIRTQTRIRRGEQGGVKFSSKTGEEACEDTGIHNYETKFAALEDPLPVAMPHGQRRDVGLLSDLLRDYGDDSDTSGRSTSDSEVELLSAAGGDASQREIQYQESITQLADVDTRTHPGHGSETDISKGERNIPDFRDRHGSSFFASAAEDSRHKADVNLETSSDPVKNPLGRLISENVLEKVDSGDALRDVSLLRLIASTARVVRALCAARTRDMAYSNLRTAELGDVVDAIPVSMVQARMAAQVALEERVRLEGCIAAWTEVEETASRVLHQRP